MVSKAREDLPEPETPVITVTRSWGRATDTFFRLFCRAPSMRSHRGCAIRSVLLRWKVYPRRQGRSNHQPRRPLTEGKRREYGLFANENHSQEQRRPPFARAASASPALA